ncbi:MAG: polymer-forming cytoskeletal protein [Betaproteobacteria bacterium]
MAENFQKGSMFVGEGVTLKGSFSIPETITIAGTVEGDITAKEVSIAVTGVVKGLVRADVVDICGEMHDSLISNKSLFIRSTGLMIGSVKYEELEIEKGGRIEGQIDKVATQPDLTNSN